jgi:Ca2+-binding RTX toxin-like protein
MKSHPKRRLRSCGIALATMVLVATFLMLHSDAKALTGSDSRIAVATIDGIEVFDSSGDGSDLHVLIPSGGSGFSVQDPAWSPLGTLLAYERGGAIWVADADGTNAHQVSTPDEFARDPAWSPDGRLTFFAGGDVVVVDPNGTHRTLVDPQGDLGRPVHWSGRPAWTADGRLVLLLSEPGVTGRTPYLADGDGTNLHALTYPDGNAPDLASLSFDWQLSSTGLVAYGVFVPEDSDQWVHFSTFDGTHIVEAPFDVTADLGGRDDVALSPSGQRAVVTWPGFHDPDTTGVSLWNVDLTSSTDSLHSTGGFEIPGEVAGLDWQPQCTIVGTPGPDQLTGTPGPDLICGLAGDDVIDGTGGNDVIYGGRRNDVIYGGRGNDVLVGGRDSDTIRGGRGRDLINSRRDGVTADSVGGGVGHDFCLHDGADMLRSCSGSS